jgi:hypothetical protein
MSRNITVAVVLISSTVCGLAQAPTLSRSEAKTLVRLVLRHEHIKLSRRYCTLDNLDRPGKPFSEGSYAFAAMCDFPNSAATVPYGLYIVSLRTADVWDLDGCQWFDFPALRTKQRYVQRRLHTTEQEKAVYRASTGCSFDARK